MAKSLYISDVNGNRVIERSVPGLTYIAEINSVLAPGTVSLNNIESIAADSTNFFLANNTTLYKMLMSDLSLAIDQLDVTQYNLISGMSAVGNYLFLTDGNNARIAVHLISDLSFVGSVNNYTLGQFVWPESICSDGTHAYVADYDNDNLVKILISDISGLDVTVVAPAMIGSYGPGDDNFNAIEGVCTDNTHLYICDSGNHRIVKRLCSDLSFVDDAGDKTTAIVDSVTIPSGVAWLPDYTGTFAPGDTITFSSSGATAPCTGFSWSGVAWQLDFGEVTGGVPLYDDTITSDNVDPGTSVGVYGEIDLYLAIIYTDLVNGPFEVVNDVFIDTSAGWLLGEVASDIPMTLGVGTWYTSTNSGRYPANGDLIIQRKAASGSAGFTNPYGITTDGTHIYVAEADAARIVKRLCSDLSYVSEVSTTQPTSIIEAGSYIYAVEFNSSVEKRDKTDSMTFVSSFNSATALVSNVLLNPYGICTDGTYVYIAFNDGIEL